MKKLLYISIATLTMTFSSLANAAPEPLSKEEMQVVIGAICSVDANYSNDDVQAAIKEFDTSQNISDARVNELADVAMTMQMMPGNIDVLCLQPLN